MEKLTRNKEMGRRIRTRRENMGMTRDSLAEKIDVSSKFIQDIEYGNKGMSIETLLRLSKALNVTTDYILQGSQREKTGEDDERHMIKANIMSALNSYDTSQLKIMDKVCSLLIEEALTERNNGK